MIGNENQLVQLFQNLLANALKFAGNRKPVIRIDAEPEENFYRFTIHDNGIGIDMKHADRIFTIFQQLHSRGKFSGTGIGLAVCKKIIEQHGGRIWVESTPGDGSTFYFTLPKE